MSNVPIATTGPTISPSVPFEVRRHLQVIYQKLGNHTQAFQLQQNDINNIKSGTTTIIQQGSGGGGSITPSFPVGIAVNNQSGVTSYATTSGDNNALIVFSDTSSIAVSLTLQSPPWGAYMANLSALGGGTVTLTPATGTINGVATLDILPSYGVIVAFDGNNFWAFTEPIVPVTTAAVSHKWLASYDGATGAFTLSQPAFTDISGTATTAQIGTGTPSAGDYVDGGTGAWTALPTVPQTISPVAGEFLTGYNASTGTFSQSTTPGISVTITTAALTPTGTQGSLTFLNGILTAQVQAT